MNKSRTATIVICLATFAAAPPALGQNGALGRDRAALIVQGEAMFNDWIAASGRYSDSLWAPRLDSMMRRLPAATGVPDLELTYAVLNDASVNAAALPGGFVVINRGMLDFVDSIAERQGTPTDRAGRAEAMLASVVAHELAHVTLGHADQPAEAGARTAVASSRSAAAKRRGGMKGVPDEILARQRASREEEAAADRTGALYLVRAGWEIEGALEMMRALDAAERAESRRKSELEQFSWLRSHPRAAARLAALEGYRAQIRALQTDLDDALTLIANDAEPETAIELLDRVITDFPDLPAARHARGVALQQQYFALVPVATLKVHPSTPVFGSEYLLAVRGDAVGVTRLVAAARSDLERALAVDVNAYSLSNLAVLDAYGGNAALALERSVRAAKLAPTDADVLNNLGVVRYLSGDSAGARQAFQTAVRLHGDSVPPRILFNYARTLLDARDAEGAVVMGEYLIRDHASAWAGLGRTLANAESAASPPVVASVHAPMGADTTPPRVAGVALGDVPGAVVAALGEPDERETQRGRTVWRYRAKGVTLLLTPREGIQAIELESPAADAVLGARVGDPMSVLRSAWGLPSEVNRNRFAYTRGSWSLVAERAFGLVSRIVVQRR